MSDYISRETVKQIIAAQCGECADACLEFDGIQPDCNQCLLYGAKKAIESVPAADVRPVARAEFVRCGDGKSVPFMCTHCGKTVPANLVEIWGANYCPNCGADMREEN